MTITSSLALVLTERLWQSQIAFFPFVFALFETSKLVKPVYKIAQSHVGYIIIAGCGYIIDS